MTAGSELLAFAGVMALGQFSPGPDMLLLTRTALKYGARAGVEMVFGIATGLIVHSTLAVAGLALAFDRFPVFREVMCWAAAGYLMWLAYRILNEVLMIWRSPGKVEIAEPEAARWPAVYPGAVLQSAQSKSCDLSSGC